jgi:hypothetical protein
MAKSAASPLRQCVALSGAKAKLRVGSAACPRALAPVFCLQFGLEPLVGCADMGLGEAQLAAHDVAAFDQVARVRDDAARPPPRAQAAVGDPRSAIADVFEALPLARVEQGGAGRRNVLGFEPGLAVRRKGVAVQDRRHHVLGRPREAVQ